MPLLTALSLLGICAILGICAFALIASFVRLIRRRELVAPDLMHLCLPFVLWFFLAGSGVRRSGAGDLIVLFALIAAIPASICLRTFVVTRGSSFQRSVFALCGTFCLGGVALCDLAVHTIRFAVTRSSRYPNSAFRPIGTLLGMLSVRALVSNVTDKD
jgi:hypothetical protein